MPLPGGNFMQGSSSKPEEGVAPARRSADEADRLLVLVAELQHRMRNLLGVVSSLAERTARDSDTIADFASAFAARIAALARVQEYLLRTGGAPGFDELIAAELSALGAIRPGECSDKVALDGPAGLYLPPAAIQILALALHELATNAIKYGALSQAEGRLAVSWRLARSAAQRLLRVEWIETGVLIPDRRPGTGYGRELIERALPRHFGARTRYELGCDGVRCIIQLPTQD